MTTLSVAALDTTLAVAVPAPTQLVAALDPTLVLQVAPGGATLAVTAPQAGVLTAPAAQGPMGPPGPPPDDLTFVAVTALSGQCAVYVQPDGSLAYASADLPACLDSFVGLTTGAAAAAAPVTVRAGGEMIEPSWTWTPGPVWLGLGGQLTQADPGEGIALLVGVALAATRILIDPEPAIRPA